MCNADDCRRRGDVVRPARACRRLDPPVEVRHDETLSLSYQAKLDGPNLVVRATIEPGWHTFAMDNQVRADGKACGQTVSRYRPSHHDHPDRRFADCRTVAPDRASRFLQTGTALVQLGLRASGPVRSAGTSLRFRNRPHRNSRTGLHGDRLPEYRRHDSLASRQRIRKRHRRHRSERPGTGPVVRFRRTRRIHLLETLSPSPCRTL